MAYQNVKIKQGTFYLSSKEDKGDGWTKQEFTSPSSGESMIRYHKNLSMEGEYQRAKFKEDRYRGNVFSVSLKADNGDFLVLETPVWSPSKGVRKTDDYFNSLIGPLLTLNKGDKITMFVNSKNKDSEGRLYRSIVFLDSEGNLIKSPFSFKDVPKWDSTEEKDLVLGGTKMTYDATKANEFYIEKAKEIISNSETSSDTTATEAIPKTEAAKQLEESKKAIEDLPEDDLPF